jgi:oligogalacturonide transporter
VSHTILLILSVGTLVVLACGFLVSLRFKLNLQTHSVLRSETSECANRHAQPELTSAEHRAVVEMLAGMPYDCLWGNNNIGYLNRHKPAAPALTQGGALNSTYNRG